MNEKELQAEALKNLYVDSLSENSTQNATLNEGADPAIKSNETPAPLPTTGDGGDTGSNRALGVSKERMYCLKLHPHPVGQCAAGHKCVRQYIDAAPHRHRK